MICEGKNAGGKSLGGFTLAEVALALGIASFCILSIVGLLPVGMNSIRTARNGIAATSVAERISKAILNASITGTTASVEYAALAPYDWISWSTGGASVNREYSNLSYGGIPASNILDQQFNAHIQITPPANLASSGTALVSIAWPVQARWDASRQCWADSQGSVSTWVVFLPRK